MLDKISASTKTGRLGEIIVGFHLEANGVQTAVVDREEIDLWVRTPTGRMLTVQVKTASKPLPRRDTQRDVYSYYLPKTTTADLFALVALDQGLVLFFPNNLKTSNVRASKFTPEAMVASIAEHLS